MGEKKRHCQRGEASTSKPCPTYNYSKTSSDHAKMTQQDTPPKPAWFGVKTGWSFSLGEFSHLLFCLLFFSYSCLDVVVGCNLLPSLKTNITLENHHVSHRRYIVIIHAAGLFRRQSFVRDFPQGWTEIPQCRCGLDAHQSTMTSKQGSGERRTVGTST